MMVRAKMLCNFPGKLCLGIIAFSKYNRKSTRLRPVSTENPNQAAGIDAPRKEYSYGDVADQLHPHGLVEHLRDLVFEALPIFWRGLRRVLVRLISLGISKVPILFNRG